jgi:YHS domain-containing protein
MKVQINNFGLEITMLAVLGLVLATSDPVWAADKPAGDAYPLNYCLVSGEKLGAMGEPVAFKHQGREITFCCSGCIDEFKAHADTYMGKLDSAVIEQQLPFYPLATSIVSGKALGLKTGAYVNMVYGNRLVRLASSKEAGEFAKAPEKYLAQLDSAVIAAQKESYPLKTCVISGMELGGMGEPYNFVHGNRLVRFCCAGCVDAFRADPVADLARIDAALKTQKTTEPSAPVKKDKSG